MNKITVVLHVIIESGARASFGVAFLLAITAGTLGVVTLAHPAVFDGAVSPRVLYNRRAAGAALAALALIGLRLALMIPVI